jgi:hypothetical protein
VTGGTPSGYLSIVIFDRTDAVLIFLGYASQNILTPGELLRPDSFCLCARAMSNKAPPSRAFSRPSWDLRDVVSWLTASLAGPNSITYEYST